tara:strand:+ start:3024 stop:3929 length:906 start_codon:yes stop_codon:yes gene_type:complete
MGQIQKKSAVNQTKINKEIVDCIEKMQSFNLFNAAILTEQQEYTLLKESKSSNSLIAKKATDKLSRSFFKLAFKQARIKFETINHKINFEDLLSEANIGVLKAIQNFNINFWGKSKTKDATKTLRFSGYANFWISKYINHYCQNNSSIIKFCTSKDDEKIFYNIGKTISLLNIKKNCCELNNEEIKKISLKLNVNSENIKKYINSMNIVNDDNSNIEEELLQSYKFNSSVIQNNIEKQIDREKILSNKELKILNYYNYGYGLEEIAKKNKSNKETIRLTLNKIIKKINPEQELKITNQIRT